VLWSRLRIRLLRILWNRPLDVLAGTVLTRPWLLLSAGRLRFWMFGWMRLSALAVRLRTIRRREMLLAVRVMLWPVLWPDVWSAVRGRLWRGVRFNLWSALCPVLRQPLWFAVRTRPLRMRAVLRQLLRWSRGWIGVRPVRSRSVRSRSVRTRMLCPRRLRQLPSELRRNAESLWSGLLPDAHLRDHSGASARFHQPAWVSARYWSGGAHPRCSVDTDSQADVFAARR